MLVRCPQCQTAIDLASDEKLSDIACPSCGSSFSLLGTEETLPHDGETKTIGHFELVEQVGIGSFGAVWKAKDNELDRVVAVKIPRKGQLDVDETEQFLREARAAAQLRHPNIVSVHEVGREQDTVFIVSDFIEGVTLADHLTAQRFSVREAAELCAKIADALQHAHEQGIVHRDLKPGNIILDGDGNPHIMDFGLARREAGEVTMTVEGRVLGTPAYMSPEQAKGSAHTADRRSDVYSLGVVLFELLTGERPFRGNIRMLVHQVINDEPPSPRRLNGGVPRDLETIVLKCLEKEPNKRYESAKQLAHDLRRFVAGEPIEARPVGRLELGWRWCKRNTVIAILSVSILTILVIGIVSVTVFWAKAKASAETLSQNVYNLRIGHAFRAHGDGDLERLEDLLRLCLPYGDARDLRDFEWRLLLRSYLNSRPLKTLEFDLPATCLVVTRGDRVFVGSHGPEVFCIDTATWRHEKPLVIQPCNGTEWSSTTELALLPSEEGLLIGGTLADGRGAVALATTISENPAVQHTFETAVTDIVVSGEGVCVVATKQGSVHAWCMTEPSEAWQQDYDVGVFTQHTKQWESLRISAGGKLLAVTRARGKELELWDLRSGECLQRYPCIGVRDVQFSQDGTILAVSHVTGIDILSIENDSMRFEKRIPKRAIHAVFTPNGSEIIMADSFGGVRIIDLDTSQQICRLVHRQGISSVLGMDYLNGGGRLITVDAFGSIKVWDLEEAFPPTQQCGRNTSAFAFVGLSAERPLLAISGRDRQSVALWDLADGSVREIGKHADVLGMAVSSGGLLVASGGEHGLVRIWDTQTGSIVWEVETGMPSAWSLAFSPDDEWLACGGEGKVLLLNIADEKTREMSGHMPGSIFHSVDFSPDGHLLIAGGGKHNYHESSNQGETLLWDLRIVDNKWVERIEHSQVVYAVDFSPTRNQFAAGGLDASVVLYDLDKRKSTEITGKSWWVTGLAYTCDGNRLATASDGMVTFWNPVTLDEIGTFRLNEQVRRIAFLQDAMVTASTEGFVRVWQAVPKEEADMAGESWKD